MRWIINKPEPEIGDIRHRLKFAFLPTKVNRYKVWLESYQVTESYQEVVSSTDDIPFTCWVEISRRTCDYYV